MNFDKDLIKKNEYMPSVIKEFENKIPDFMINLRII